MSPVAGEEDQARAYVRYIESALYNPYFVGAHFFLYCDQAATGRPSEGENLQTGFVDVTDTPYPKLVEAAREVSADLYRCRMEMGTAFTSPDPSR